MRKLLVKLLLFITPLFIGIISLDLIIDDSIFYYNSEVYRKVYDYMINKDRIKTVVLGSSHADNAISESYSSDISNLANQGQDLAHDFWLVNRIRDFDSVENIIITLSYFSFNYDESSIWPFRSLDYEDVNALFPEKNPLKLHDYLYDNSILVNYNFPINRIINLLLRSGRKKIKSKGVPLNDRIDLELDAVKRAVRVHNTYYNVETEKNYIYLDSLISLFSNKFIVFVLPPFSNSYNKNYPKEKIDRFYRDLNYYIDDKKIPILDYTHDTIFSNSPELFLNSDHLNKKGAAVFTQKLMNDIKKLKQRE